MMLAIGRERITPYYEDYKPVEVRRNNIKLAGWLPSTKTGALLAFDGTYNDTVESLTVPGRFTQNGTPSPDNPVPVTGVQPGKVTVSGRNLVNQSVVLPQNGWVLQPDGSFFVENNGTINQKLLWENNSGYTGQVSIHYTFKYLNGAGYIGSVLQVRYTDGTRWSLITVNSPDYQEFSTVTFVTPAEKTVQNIAWTYGTGPNSTWVKDVMVAYGTDTAYEPYSGHDYPLSLPSPLYSLLEGTRDEYDAASGILTGRIGVKVFTGSETVTHDFMVGEIARFQLAYALPGGLGGETNKQCTHFLVSGVDVGEHCRGSANPNTGSLFLFFINPSRLSGWDDALTAIEKANLFKNWLAAQHAAGTPVTVLYKLATPQPVSLSPMTIQTTPRQCNISADGAEVTATVKTVDTNL